MFVCVANGGHARVDKLGAASQKESSDWPNS